MTAAEIQRKLDETLAKIAALSIEMKAVLDHLPNDWQGFEILSYALPPQVAEQPKPKYQGVYRSSLPPEPAPEPEKRKKLASVEEAMQRIDDIRAQGMQPQHLAELKKQLTVMPLAQQREVARQVGVPEDLIAADRIGVKLRFAVEAQLRATAPNEQVEIETAGVPGVETPPTETPSPTPSGLILNVHQLKTLLREARRYHEQLEREQQWEIRRLERESLSERRRLEREQLRETRRLERLSHRSANPHIEAKRLKDARMRFAAFQAIPDPLPGPFLV